MTTHVTRTENSMIADVAVVIPWGGSDRDLLQLQLAAVASSAQHAAQRGITVDVVLACNHKSSLEEAYALSQEPQLREIVRTVDASDVRGPAHARNIGTRSTRAPLILFCDADDEVDREWILQMTNAFDEHELIRGGMRSRDDAGVNDAPSSAVAALPKPIYDHLNYGPMSTLGVTRAAFDRVGGIDETLHIGEDVDFCWRVQYAGASFIYAPAALTTVRRRQKLSDHFRQAFAWGVGDAELLRRHRSHGARPTSARRLLHELSVMTARGLLAPVSKRHRWASTHQAGKTLGRIFGSIKCRRWSL